MKRAKLEKGKKSCDKVRELGNEWLLPDRLLPLDTAYTTDPGAQPCLHHQLAPAMAAKTLTSLSINCPSLSQRLSSSQLPLPGAFRLKRRATPVTAMSSTATKVVPAVIVGGGRVGRALQDMGNGGDVLVKRGEPVPADFEGPILVCTRNDDLEAVLEATPRNRWSGTFLLPFCGCLLFLVCSCSVFIGIVRTLGTRIELKIGFFCSLLLPRQLRYFRGSDEFTV